MPTDEKPKIYINPPPPDARCECCGRHITEIPDHTLRKDFRGDECIGAYWVCGSCMMLDDATFWKLYCKHDGFLDWYVSSETRDLAEFFELLDDGK